MNDCFQYKTSLSSRPAVKFTGSEESIMCIHRRGTLWLDAHIHAVKTNFNHTL